MKIVAVIPGRDRTLTVTADDGRTGRFDVSPYLTLDAFEALADPDEFEKVAHGEYFVEWPCGADFSADTIEARWTLTD